MRNTLDRVAAAPISWGICEVEGWGHQLQPQRVLSEISELGFHAIELGPEGFLPDDPASLRALLGSHVLKLVGGFVPAVLHDATRLETELTAVAEVADLLGSASAEVLVVAAASAHTGYEVSERLDTRAWMMLAHGIERVEEVADSRGLRVALHPHYGTAIEGRRDIERVLDSSSVALCIDTGHLTVAGADPLDVVKSVLGRIAHVHLKDVDVGLSRLVGSGALGYQEAVRRGMYRPLGSGDVDLESVIALLQASGYDGWLVLEQDRVLNEEPEKGGGPIGDARTGMEFMRRVISDSQAQQSA